MKILKQLGILFLLSFLCELISSFLPFTFPASVLAMIILFILLATNLIKEKYIEETSFFLQKNMALFFIPPAVSIIDEFNIFKDKIFQIIFISFISFLITFIATAFTVNLVIKIQSKFKNKKEIL